MGTAAAIGSVLGGRYRIVSVLGAGSMATVFRATQADGPDVAVKLLRAKISHPEAAADRLFREARVISRLEHPGCVRLLDWGVDDGRTYVVLELIEGESLSEAMAREKRLSPARAIGIVRAMCDVLEAAHALGVVHRDLKPGNVMLVKTRGREAVKVLDFGLARLAPQKDADETQPRELTRPGSTLGTPSYMAPEQVRGSRVDGRADVYACGVMLFELITGVLPIEGETAIDTMLKQATDPPREVLEVAPDLDVELAAAIMRCLEKDPERRFPSAAALSAEIHRRLPRSDELTGVTRGVSPDATTTFVREPLHPAEQTSTVLRPLSASGSPQPATAPPAPPARPRAAPPRTQPPRTQPPRTQPPRTQPPPPPKRKPSRRPRAETTTRVEGENEPTVRSQASSGLASSQPGPSREGPTAPAARPLLPLKLPSMPKVRVVDADREATKLHTRLPDVSEMEVTIPAHGRVAMVDDDLHDMERTIPVTSLPERPTEVHDVGDWVSTRRLQQVRDADVAGLTSAAKGTEGPPPPSSPAPVVPPPAPSAPHAPPSVPRAQASAPHAPPSSSRAQPSAPQAAPSAVPSAPHADLPRAARARVAPPMTLPGTPRPEQPSHALADVLSGLPAEERRWLVAAAIAGVACAVLLAVWLLL